MDPVSQVLAQDLPPDVRRTYAAVAEHGQVSCTTVWYRHRGRPSRRLKVECQQYLNPLEEKAFVMFLLRMVAFGFLVCIKFIPLLAFSLARRRSSAKAIKLLNKNWFQAFACRHPELKQRKIKAIDWKCHDKSIYEKIIHWFEVIETEFRKLDILPENVYNMDETGVMLFMLGSIKVLVGKDDRRDYRSVGVKQTLVTAIECISASGEYLNLMIIWPVFIHRSNWTMYFGWVYGYFEFGYNDSYISLQWMKQVFDLQTKIKANKNPRILICDGFGTHETLEILEFCFENNIILCRLLFHTFHKLQPCDVAVFGPLKRLIATRWNDYTVQA